LDEWPNWLLLLVRLAVSLAVWGAFFYFGLWLSGGKVIGGVGFSLLAVPVFGIALAKPLVLISHEGMSWLWHQPMRKWQGSYYAFNDRQVRIFEGEDRLWFAAKDVLAAVGMKAIPDSFLAVYPEGCKVLPGSFLTALDADAIRSLLGKRNEHESIRFLQWMEREVLKPWARKKERGL
jgi:hypothetical protein